MKRIVSLVALTLLVAVAPALASGKNKVIRHSFDWKIFHTDHFKIFYYPEEAGQLEQVANMCEASYKHVSDKLQHQLNFPVPMIIFKTHEEFEQTNVFPGFLPRSVEGFSEPFQSRILLSIDREPDHLFALIRHELTHIFQYDMLFNNRIGTIIRADAPKWFIEGMASYVADDEDNLDRMFLRDAAVNADFGSLGDYANQSYTAYRVGHAVFDFIEEKHGIEGVRDFLWQYRKNVTGSISSAIQRAFEVDVEDFDRDFRKYLRKRYIDLLPKKEEPDDHSHEIRTKNVITTLSPELSPSGDLMAAIVPVKNDIDLVLISTKDGRIFKNLTKGHSNDYSSINIGAFNGVNDLGWNKDGKEIVFAARREGTMVFFVINVLNGDITDRVSFPDIRDATSPVFSDDGKSIFFSGNRNGYYDLFRFVRESGEVTNLTNDEHMDRNPRISPDGKELLYSSLRDGFFKIHSLELASGTKRQLTSGLGNDIQGTYSHDMKSIYFSSDRFDDIYNIYELELETGVKKQYTNVLTGAFAPQERIVFDHKEGVEKRAIVFTAFYQGRYRAYKMDKPEEREQFYDVASDNFSNVKDYDYNLNIKIDPDKVTDYTLRKNFTIAGADISAGLIDDGRVVSDTTVQFTDTVGNHNLVLSTYTISSYESYLLNYTNRKNRLNWGAAMQIEESFFLQYELTDPNNATIDRAERRFKDNSVIGYLSYPFSTYSRFDFGGGLSDRDYVTLEERVIDRPQPDGSIVQQVVYIGVKADFTEPTAFMSFSRDTVRYQQWGPQQGMGLDLSYNWIASQSNTYSLNLRAYKELTRRTLFALRLVGNYSDGDVPTLFTLGGRNDLRGDFDYQEFIGSRRVLLQGEYRFPLIDQLRFPGFALGNIRGALFLDMGGAWINDDRFNFEFQTDEEGFNDDFINNDYLQASLGLGISLNLFGVDVNWTWARRTNFETFPEGNRMSFWIGRNF